VSKPSVVSAADAPYQRQHYTTPLNIHTTPAPTCQALPLAPTVISSENINQAKTTRRQLESDAEMCMFALTVSRTEPKNIKEAMTDSAWIESLQEELHQFDRLDVWELVDRPLCTKAAIDYGFYFDKIPMYCDSKAAIAVSCNSVQHSRTKHIDVRYYFIKEKVEKGIVKLFFVGTEYQLADLFTKALPVERFKYLVRRLGMRCLTPAELEALANESA
nr:retrotransposon protein, putative, unclassified [Tanacetum cinerariifolium]